MDSERQLEFKISEYGPRDEPFYLDVNGETEIFMAAYREKIPVMLKGPTGCGKSRFVERMAWELSQESRKAGGGPRPLITVTCHEDLDALDLTGRPRIDGSFEDGPALIAVKTKSGAILYFDEIIEARSNTSVIIHPLTDQRRMMSILELGKVYEAPEKHITVASYNPGYQKKSLKPSTKQRFIAMNFNYPPKELETKILMHESNIDENLAKCLVNIGEHVRNLKGKIEEGASTRLLIYAGKLIRQGINPMRACEVAILNPLTDDLDISKSMEDIIKLYFPKK